MQLINVALQLVAVLSRVTIFRSSGIPPVGIPVLPIPEWTESSPNVVGCYWSRSRAGSTGTQRRMSDWLTGTELRNRPVVFEIPSHPHYCQGVREVTASVQWHEGSGRSIRQFAFENQLP